MGFAGPPIVLFIGFANSFLFWVELLIRDAEPKIN